MKRIKMYFAAKPDFLELGIPFSDPIADGAVIQSADSRALSAGMTPKKSLAFIAKIRGITDIPIGILTYANIVFRYGIAAFYRDLKKAGADSILIADIPLEEIGEFAAAAKKYHLHQVFLVSENTDTARLKKILRITSGFLYVVSALGVTGKSCAFSARYFSNLKNLIKRLKKYTSLPLMVGFGISRKAHIRGLESAGADGAIIGSHLVKTPLQKLQKILHSLKLL